jgi:outer membrane protein TolC
VTATGAYVRNSDAAGLSVGPPLVPEPRSVIIQPEEQWTGAVALRVPLVAPSAWFDRAAARGAARAADATLGAVRLQLRAAFRQAAHAARAAEELVAASEAALGSAAELARSAARRVAAGTAAPLDRLRAETEQVRRESDLARARAELARARLGLGVLLGREGPVRVLVPEPSPAAPEGDLAAAALAARPELAAARAQVDAAGAQVRSAWARLLPQLSASGSAFASDVAYPTGETEGWRASLDLAWPLYDGGLRGGKRREAEARRAQAAAAAEAQRLAVLQEVRDAARDLAVARERLRLAEQQRALATDAQGTAQRSFEAGLASSLDVLDANDRRYVADVGLAEARARLATARAALDRAVGREGGDGAGG